MSVYNIFLLVHIVSGAICLITGAMASFASKRRGRHTMMGEIYHGGYVAIFCSSVVMAIMHWSESAYLFYIALFSYGLALFGYLAKKYRWKNWLTKHISGMLGSYIGIITATLVVNGSKIPLINEIPSLVLWFAPTVIGTPIISLVNRRYIKTKKVKEIAR